VRLPKKDDAVRHLVPDGHAEKLASATAESRCSRMDAEELLDRAQDASNLMKALAHEGRLMILCHLSSGEKSVTELENLLESRQAAVSQQLARLRLEGLVSARREGKAIYYTLSDPRARRLVETIYDMFCATD
jgi:ArsR family transcriptional regulator